MTLYVSTKAKEHKIPQFVKLQRPPNREIAYSQKQERYKKQHLVLKAKRHHLAKRIYKKILEQCDCKPISTLHAIVDAINHVEIKHITKERHKDKSGD